MFVVLELASFEALPGLANEGPVVHGPCSNCCIGGTSSVSGRQPTELTNTSSNFPTLHDASYSGGRGDETLHLTMIA